MAEEISQKEIDTLRAIKAGVISGKSDEDIGKNIGLSGFKISVLRQFLGYKRAAANIFTDFRKLGWNEGNETFIVSNFTIPEDKRKELGLKIGANYKLLASVENGGIRIEIMQE